MIKLTEEQITQIVKLYKTGLPLKYVAKTTGIPGATISTLIRRKYPELKRRGETAKRKRMLFHSKRIMEQLGVTDSRAQWIYENMEKKFFTKRNRTLTDGKEFTCELSDVFFPTHCPILGVELDYMLESCHKVNAPTFDRIDNNKGYVPGNVAIISFRANRLKSNGTADEHAAIAAYMGAAEVA